MSMYIYTFYFTLHLYSRRLMINGPFYIQSFMVRSLYLIVELQPKVYLILYLKFHNFSALSCQLQANHIPYFPDLFAKRHPILPLQS